ncbi:unnamed protein product [Pieris brassicae]|uniref:Uncharacterized protein n=1 Tax=Pieris brassicae TaxID=7116 RepID=A0A9P0WZY1_PIEBR|nr:unnamed protein product [Pieris brassicae]
MEISTNPEGSSNAITVQVDNFHHRHCSQLSASITSHLCGNETEAMSYLYSIHRGYPRTAAERMQEYRARKKKETLIVTYLTQSVQKRIEPEKSDNPISRSRKAIPIRILTLYRRIILGQIVYNCYYFFKERSANKIRETVTLDNGNVSDDDVIEVVIDDTPIEILSDEEEMQLEKTRASVIEQSFEFTTPQTPETSFNERKDIIDPLTSFVPIGDNQSILETHITSTMSINETFKESTTTEVEVNVDKAFIETPEVKNSDEPKDRNEDNTVLSEVEKLNVPCQSNEPGTVITEPVIN